MALGEEEVEIRLLQVEIAMSTVWSLLSNVINREQFNRLNVLRQKEIELLTTRVETLESQVAQLQVAYNNLL
jgi:polyhydroxyalkanoate synthesis regulator phasin